MHPPVLSDRPTRAARFSPTALRVTRHRAGLSREKLARAADVSLDSIRSYERGRYKTGPSFDAVCRIAAALGVALQDLTDEAAHW